MKQKKESVTFKYTHMSDWVNTLEKRLATRPDGVEVILRKVEPHKVDELYLTHPDSPINRLNLKSRPPLTPQVKLISDDIVNNRWDEFVDNIKYILDPTSEHDGVLASGQHRLLAVAKAKKTVWVEFQGISNSSIRLVDTNRHRTPTRTRMAIM